MMVQTQNAAAEEKKAALCVYPADEGLQMPEPPFYTPIYLCAQHH